MSRLIPFALFAFAVFASPILARPATFAFTVPPDASIVIDKKPLPGVSAHRQFQTGPLHDDVDYFYDVVVTLRRDGKEHRAKERIAFRAGDRVERSFLDLLNDAEARGYPKKSQIPTELRLHDARKRDEVRNVLANDASRTVLAGASPMEAVYYQNRSSILTEVLDRDPIAVDPDSIVDVRYDRLDLDRLKVTIEVRNGMQRVRFAGGSIANREIDRLYCHYRKVNGDWMLEKYWSLGGDTLGDYLIRFENGLGMASQFVTES